MTAKDFMLFRLKEIIKAEEEKNNNSLIIFKGFPAFFFNELDNHIKSIGNRKTRNSLDYIDVSLLNNEKNDLLLKFFTERGVKWAFYEEFILLTEMINGIQERYSGEMKIYYNTQQCFRSP